MGGKRARAFSSVAFAPCTLTHNSLFALACVFRVSSLSSPRSFVHVAASCSTTLVRFTFTSLFRRNDPIQNHRFSIWDPREVVFLRLFRRLFRTIVSVKSFRFKFLRHFSLVETFHYQNIIFDWSLGFTFHQLFKFLQYLFYPSISSGILRYTHLKRSILFFFFIQSIVRLI